jgi:hypothetical protein
MLTLCKALSITLTASKNMRTPTRTEWSIAFSLLALITACLFAAVMAKIMENIFFAMYSDATHPWITKTFLLAGTWGFIVPLPLGIAVYLRWNKGRLESDAPLLIVIMHLISLAVMAVITLGMLWPLLTTTFGMGK